MGMNEIKVKRLWVDDKIDQSQKLSLIQKIACRLFNIEPQTRSYRKIHAVIDLKEGEMLYTGDIIIPTYNKIHLRIMSIDNSFGDNESKLIMMPIHPIQDEIICINSFIVIANSICE